MPECHRSFCSLIVEVFAWHLGVRDGKLLLTRFIYEKACRDLFSWIANISDHFDDVEA